MIRYLKEEFVSLSVDKKINLIIDDSSYIPAYGKFLPAEEIVHIIQKIPVEKIGILLREIEFPTDEIQKIAIEKNVCNFLKELSERNQKNLIQKTVLSGIHSVKCFSEVQFSPYCQDMIYSYFKNDSLNMFSLCENVQRRIVKDYPSSVFLIYKKFLNVDSSLYNAIMNFSKKDNFLIINDHIHGVKGFKTKNFSYMSDFDVVNKIRSNPSFIYSVVRPTERMLRTAFSYDLSTVMLLKDEFVSYTSREISDNIAAQIVRSNLKSKETYLNLIREKISFPLESKIIQFDPLLFYSIRNPSEQIRDLFIKIKTFIPKGKNFLSRL